jgi:hypothetical protein
MICAHVPSLYPTFLQGLIEPYRSDHELAFSILGTLFR